MIATTPNLGACISGAILYDETIRQKTKEGTSILNALIDSGILPGIKWTMGRRIFAGRPWEKAKEGLYGLRERLAEFLKWVLALPNGVR